MIIYLSVYVCKIINKKVTKQEELQARKGELIIPCNFAVINLRSS